MRAHLSTSTSTDASGTTLPATEPTVISTLAASAVAATIATSESAATVAAALAASVATAAVATALAPTLASSALTTACAAAFAASSVTTTLAAPTHSAASVAPTFAAAPTLDVAPERWAAAAAYGAPHFCRAGGPRAPPLAQPAARGVGGRRLHAAPRAHARSERCTPPRRGRRRVGGGGSEGIGLAAVCFGRDALLRGRGGPQRQHHRARVRRARSRRCRAAPPFATAV